MSKLLKYGISFLLLVCITTVAFLFPGYYFENYEYESSIETMGAQEFVSIEEGSASAYQVYKMLEDRNYDRTLAYDAEKEGYSVEKTESYAAMVAEVIKGYLNGGTSDYEIDAEELPYSGKSGIFWECLRQWYQEKESWKVTKVQIYNASEMFNGKMVYVKLYELHITEPDLGNSMDILFDTEKKMFYRMNVYDERFSLEDIEENYFGDDLIYGYWYARGKGEMDEMEKLSRMVEVITAPGVILIGN